MMIALIIACMMLICLPILCEADDENGGDDHVGTGAVRIINIANVRG